MHLYDQCDQLKDHFSRCDQPPIRRLKLHQRAWHNSSGQALDVSAQRLQAQLRQGKLNLL
jgi:hypothetical protein